MNFSESWHYRTIWQGATASDFASIQSFKNEGILYVFPIFEAAEVGKKNGCGPQTQLDGDAINMVTAYRAERRTDLLQTPRILCPVSVGGGGTENALCPRRFSCQSRMCICNWDV